MRTNYLCHVENIIDIQWSRHVGRWGGDRPPCFKPEADQKSVLASSNFEVANKQDVVLEVINLQAIP